MGADGPRAGRAGHLRGRAGLTLEADEKLAALDALVAALAHPARRQILLTIHFRGSASAGEIAGRFAHKWPTTTRHLRVLEDAALIEHEKQGRNRVYRVNQARLSLLVEWLSWFDSPAPQSGDPTSEEAK